MSFLFNLKVLQVALNSALFPQSQLSMGGGCIVPAEASQKFGNRIEDDEVPRARRHVQSINTHFGWPGPLQGTVAGGSRLLHWYGGGEGVHPGGGESHVLRECICHCLSFWGWDKLLLCVKQRCCVQTSENLMGREAQQGRGSMTAAKAERGSFWLFGLITG